MRGADADASAEEDAGGRPVAPPDRVAEPTVGDDRQRPPRTSAMSARPVDRWSGAVAAARPSPGPSPTGDRWSRSSVRPEAGGGARWPDNSVSGRAQPASSAHQPIADAAPIATVDTITATPRQVGPAAPPPAGGTAAAPKPHSPPSPATATDQHIPDGRAPTPSDIRHPRDFGPGNTSPRPPTSSPAGNPAWTRTDSQAPSAGRETTGRPTTRAVPEVSGPHQHGWPSRSYTPGTRPRPPRGPATPYTPTIHPHAAGWDDTAAALHHTADLRGVPR